MGYNHSYHLYVYREDVWTMLRALGRHASPLLLNTVHTMVHLAEGEVLDIPFTSDFKTDPLFYTEQTSELQFDVVLWLLIVENEREMFRGDDWEIDEQGMVCFGYLYLTIDFRSDKAGRLLSFRFDAATDGMSDLMEHSQSLRRAFGMLLKEGNGLCGILEMDGYREDEAILWWLKGQTREQWFAVPGEEEVSAADRWFSRHFDHLVERWLQE